MLVSECCDAMPWVDAAYGICSDCKEHCDFYLEE